MKLYAFLAEGFEEIEALTVVDIIRRAGINMITVSVTEEKAVKGSHNITVMADRTVDEIDFSEGELIFLPGGIPGTPNLEKCEKLISAILEYNKNGKRLAAVCAAPSIYGKLGLLKGKKATCFPGFEEELKGAELVADRVVTDGNITTSRGMGTTMDLGLEIVRLYKGDAEAESLGKKIQYFI